MIVDPDDDERAHSRRYTEDGINVVALDPHGRGLRRARPERRYPTYSFLRREEPRRVWPTLVFVALLLAVLALVILRARS